MSHIYTDLSYNGDKYCICFCGNACIDCTKKDCGTCYHRSVCYTCGNDCGYFCPEDNRFIHEDCQRCGCCKLLLISNEDGCEHCRLCKACDNCSKYYIQSDRESSPLESLYEA